MIHIKKVGVVVCVIVLHYCIPDEALTVCVYG